MITVNIPDLKEEIKLSLKSDIPSFIHGSPGTGKSDIVAQVAEETGHKLIDIRLSQYEPTDLNGLPFRDGDRSTFLPTDQIPLASDKDVPPTILFLDEFKDAQRQTLAAAYRLVLDRCVGTKPIHPSIRIVAAGNLVLDGGFAMPLPTPIKSRFTHYQIQPSAKEWLKWAEKSGIRNEILDYIRFMPDEIFNMENADTDEVNAFPCPRTWAMMSAGMFDAPMNKIPKHRIHGTIGEAAGSGFYLYAAAFAEVPTMDEIIAGTAMVPKANNAALAVLSSISGNIRDKMVDPKDYGKVWGYVEKFQVELVSTMVKEVLKNTPEFLAIRGVIDWSRKNSNYKAGNPAKTPSGIDTSYQTPSDVTLN